VHVFGVPKTILIVVDRRLIIVLFYIITNIIYLFDFDRLLIVLCGLLLLSGVICVAFYSKSRNINTAYTSESVRIIEDTGKLPNAVNNGR